MKKFFVFILVIILLSLTSCKKEKYGLVELSGIEVGKSFFASEDSDKVSFVLAFYNPSNDNTEEFLSDLEKIARRSREMIYYMDTVHTDFTSYLLIEQFLSLNNNYIVFQDGKLIIRNDYTNYNDLLADLNGKRYNPKIEYSSKEYIKEKVEAAEKDFNEGKMSTALGNLLYVWNSKEAQDFYKAHNELKIVNYWVGYSQSKVEGNIHYLALAIQYYFNTIIVYETDEPSKGFVEPNEGKRYYYYLKGNYIYVSETEDGEYEKKYKIDRITDDKLYVVVDKVVLGMYAK